MAENCSQHVQIVIKKDSALYEKIESLAEQTGQTFDQVFSSVATTGIYHHMLGNALLMQRSLQLHGKED